MPVLPPGDYRDLFNKDGIEELGTSMQAFLLCYVYKDGSSVARVIRGYDSNASEYALALRNFLETTNKDDLGLKMRALNLLTIQPNGLLYVTNVEDKNIINGNSTSKYFLDDIIDTIKEVEYGEVNSQLLGVATIADVIFFNEYTGQFTDGSNLLGDVGKETFTGDEPVMTDINHLYEELDYVINTDDETPNVEYQLRDDMSVYEIESLIREQQMNNLIDEMVDDDFESEYQDDVDGVFIPEG